MRAPSRSHRFVAGLVALCLTLAAKNSSAQPAEPLLIPLQTFDLKMRSVGLLASSEEICKLLGHRFFQRPADAYRLLDSESSTLTWDGVEASHLWVARKFEEAGIPKGRLVMEPQALKKAEEQLARCLQGKETEQPELYNILKKHFLHYLPAHCHKPIGQVRKSVDDQGNLSDLKVPTARKPCIDFDYNSGQYGHWNSTTLSLMLIWKEAHPVLTRIFDRGDALLQTRMAAQAQKEQQAEGEERRRLAAEKTQEAQRSWLEYAARDKTLLEQVFNFATVGEVTGAQHERWTEVQTCTVTDGRRQIDVRKLNMTAFRVFPDWVGSTRQLVSTDGAMRLATSKQIPMDRLQNAWRLAFQSCPGTRSRF